MAHIHVKMVQFVRLPSGGMPGSPINDILHALKQEQEIRETGAMPEGTRYLVAVQGMDMLAQSDNSFPEAIAKLTKHVEDVYQGHEVHVHLQPPKTLPPTRS